MIPRDVVKLAFQFQAQREIPFRFAVSTLQAVGLTTHYGGEKWRTWAAPYIQGIAGVDNFLTLNGRKRHLAFRDRGAVEEVRHSLSTETRCFAIAQHDKFYGHHHSGRSRKSGFFNSPTDGISSLLYGLF